MLYRDNLYSRFLRAFGQTPNTQTASLVLRFPPSSGVNEVSALLDYSGTTSRALRDITFYYTDSDVKQFLQPGHPAYFTLAYPLLFPRGTLLWESHYRNPRNGHKLTMEAFYLQVFLR